MFCLKYMQIYSVVLSEVFEVHVLQINHHSNTALAWWLLQK